jgi:hypothetical protein
MVIDVGWYRELDFSLEWYRELEIWKYSFHKGVIGNSIGWYSGLG